MKTTEKILQLSSIAMIMVACVSCESGKIIASISNNNDIRDNKAHVIASFYNKETKKPIESCGELFVKNSMEEVSRYRSIESSNNVELSLEPGTYRFKGTCYYISSYSDLSIKDVSVARGDTLKLIFYMLKKEAPPFQMM